MRRLTVARTSGVIDIDRAGTAGEIWTVGDDGPPSTGQRLGPITLTASNGNARSAVCRRRWQLVRRTSIRSRPDRWGRAVCSTHAIAGQPGDDLAGHVDSAGLARL